MTTGPGTGRLSTSEAARGFQNIAEAMATRQPLPPECSVTIGTTAKRIHTWEITVRGEDVGECYRKARSIDDGLSAKYAHELEDADDLGAKLAASVIKREGK